MEPTETVAVLLLPGNGYRIGGGNEIRATVSILDDDDSPPEPPVTPNLSVSPSSGLVTDEDGGTAEFEVVLTAQPEMEIGVVFESSDTTEGTVSPTSITFGMENWNVPQTITVTGQPDDEEDGNQPYTIMLTPSEAYEGNTPPNVSVTNMDKTPPPEPATAAFTQAVYTVAEADGVAQVSVKRMGNPDVALTAFVSTLDDSGDTTATAGEDYTSVSDAEVSWAAGDTEDKVVEITVFENTDTITGKNEKVALSLTGEGIDEMASLEIESDVGDDIVGGISDELVPPNQQEIVSVILDTCPLGGNADDFQGLCTALVFSAADGNSVANAIKAATPDDAAAVRSSGMQTTNVQVTAIDGRLGTIRGGGGAGFSASGFSMAYGDVSMSGSLLKSFINAFDQQSPEFMQANANAQDDSSAIDEFGRWGAWVSGRVVFGEKDPTTNQIDYDFDTAGITFGLDYRFTDEMVAGVAVGYSNTDAKLGSNNGELDSKGYSVAAYGTWFKGESFYMGGSLGYGSNEYDHLRNVRYTIDRPDVGSEFLPDSVFNVDQTLAADYDGSQYSASISGGWDFNKDGWTFGPTLRVSYVNVDVDAYDEFLLSSNMDPNFATGGWAVHIDKQSYESLQPSLGFEFTKAVSASWGVFIPQGYVDVVSELSDGGQLVTGQFIGDNNGARFALETDDFEETFVRAGLGFGLILKNNKSAYLMVDGDFGRDLLSTYYINAGFRWQF
jgi:outer membrane autotransporter protein